jgi:hypothetical protein
MYENENKNSFLKVLVIVIFYPSSGEGSPYYHGTGSNWQIGFYFDHPITQTNYLSYVHIP